MNIPLSNTRFKGFIERLAHAVDEHGEDEAAMLANGEPLLRELVSHDDWLPDDFAWPDLQYYQQFLLYADPDDRFSVVSFVWGPGQKTPIHDHTVWALIGMMRGSERGERFGLPVDGEPMELLGDEIMKPGDIDKVSPRLGDIHRVSNVYDDRVSISIHVYGGNIGKISRHVYDAQTGRTKPFVSGYSNGKQRPQAAAAEVRS